MNNLPQLLMRHPDITSLPPFTLPDGIALCNHTDANDAQWEELIDKSFGIQMSFEQVIRNGGGYKPEYVLYLMHEDKYIATTTAVESTNSPDEGRIKAVGVDAESRGIGAGRLIVQAALHSLASRGYKSAILYTDDERIPAINLYVSLGFEPVYTHESHQNRWEQILPKLKR